MFGITVREMAEAQAEATVAADEANVLWWDENMPEWREQSSEMDAPEFTPVSASDWDALSEMMWCDPAERALD